MRKWANFLSNSEQEVRRLWIWHKLAQQNDVTCFFSFTPLSSSGCWQVRSSSYDFRCTSLGKLTGGETRCSDETGSIKLPRGFAYQISFFKEPTLGFLGLQTLIFKDGIKLIKTTVNLFIFDMTGHYWRNTVNLSFDVEWHPNYEHFLPLLTLI